MRIHYNNGEKDKIIDNVLSIQVIDGNQPVTVLMANGKELNVSLRNIEMILDEQIFEKPKPRTNFDKITESVENLAEFLVENDKELTYFDDYYYWDYINDQPCYDREEAKQSIKEWLQQEDEA